MPHHEDYNDYDSEPVKYCSKCYSLKIKYEEAIDAECCMECGCPDILATSIEEWERLYEKRYGKKFVVKNNDPKQSPIFKLPISKLKMKVFEHPAWNEIIHKVYPRFPKGLSKADSIILFFDSIIRENKLDSLRILLLQYFRNNHGREEVKKRN